MAFYFSKEEREKRANEKENAKQLELKCKQEHEEFLKKREQELLEEYLKEMNEYCNWFNEKTIQFKEELSSRNFHANMGFEVEDAIDTKFGMGGKQIEGVTVFDIPSLSGIALDTNSKQILYYTCRGHYYNVNKEEIKEPIYKYKIINLDEIISIKVDINSVTTYQSAVSNKNVLKRSMIGGVLAGGTGAIIGGSTAQKDIQSTTLPSDIDFVIQTINDNVDTIQFNFDKSYINPNYKVASDKALTDTMISIFANMDSYFEFSEDCVSRKCGTKKDYIYKRRQLVLSSKFDEVHFYERSKINHLEIIAKRLSKYAMQMEAIVKKNNQEGNDFSGIADEISKLLVLKESGAISEEEFSALKIRIISN